LVSPAQRDYTPLDTPKRCEASFLANAFSPKREPETGNNNLPLLDSVEGQLKSGKVSDTVEVEGEFKRGKAPLNIFHSPLPLWGRGYRGWGHHY